MGPSGRQTPTFGAPPTLFNTFPLRFGGVEFGGCSYRRRQNPPQGGSAVLIPLIGQAALGAAEGRQYYKDAVAAGRSILQVLGTTVTQRDSDTDMRLQMLGTSQQQETLLEHWAYHIKQALRTRSGRQFYDSFPEILQYDVSAHAGPVDGT